MTLLVVKGFLLMGVLILVFAIASIVAVGQMRRERRAQEDFNRTVQRIRDEAVLKGYRRKGDK